MNLNISDTQMQAIVAKALLDTMTPEKRDELFTQAIQFLLTPPPPSGSGYGSGRTQRSPLQQVFDGQVEHAAREFAREKLAVDTDFKGRVERIFVDAATKIFDDDEKRSLIVDALADAMRKAITGDKY